MIKSSDIINIANSVRMTNPKHADMLMQYVNECEQMRQYYNNALKSRNKTLLELESLDQSNTAINDEILNLSNELCDIKENILTKFALDVYDQLLITDNTINDTVKKYIIKIF